MLSSKIITYCVYTFLSAERWTNNWRRQHQRGLCLLFLHGRYSQRLSIQLQPRGQPGTGMHLEPSGGHPNWGCYHCRTGQWRWRRRRWSWRRGQRQSDGGAAALLPPAEQPPLAVTSPPPQLGSWKEQRRRRRDEPEEVRLWSAQSEWFFFLVIFFVEGVVLIWKCDSLLCCEWISEQMSVLWALVDVECFRRLLRATVLVGSFQVIHAHMHTHKDSTAHNPTPAQTCTLRQQLSANINIHFTAAD